MKSKTALAILGGVGVAAVGAFFGIGEALYRLILTNNAVHGSKLLEEDKEFDEIFNTNELMLDGIDWLEEAEKEDWLVDSPRKEWLHADTVLADKPSDVWVICAHGYAVEPQSNAAQAKKFHENGYNVLMPSLNGHGRSECKYVSMGWHDRIDLCAWINLICEKNPNAKIVLYGISMGGAAVMMTVGEDLPPNVVCAIEDCGYTSVYDEFSTQVKAALHLPEFPFIPAADLVTRIHAGYGFKEASSVEQVKKAKIPMLFIHGADDDFVPAWMMDVCYNAATCEKEKLLFEGARHACSGLNEPEKYFSAVKAFIEKFI